MTAVDGCRPRVMIDDFEWLGELCKKVARYFPSQGAGDLGADVNLRFSDFLRAKEASCAQLGYLFARYALSAGFPVRRVGLYTDGGANDLMVEVRVKDRWFLFTPSAGTFYRFGLGELLARPELASRYEGDPVGANAAYLTKSFFSRITEIRVYRSLNSFGSYLRESNFAKSATIESSGFYSSHNDIERAINGLEEDYAAGVEGVLQSVELKWLAPVTPYRLFVRWLSSIEYCKNIRCKVFVNNKWIDAIGNNVETFRIEDVHEVPLRCVTPITRMAVDFFGAMGQSRALIREFGIY